MNIESRIKKIEERNQRVETDKAWEVSITRRGFIAVVTYVFSVWYLSAIGADQVWLYALIPAAGYVLSTLSLPWIRRQWERGR